MKTFNKKGSFHINAALILLVTLTIFAFFLEYARVRNVVSEVRSGSLAALRVHVTQLSNEMTATLANGEDLRSNLNLDRLLADIRSRMDLDLMSASVKDGTTVYRIEQITLTAHRTDQLKIWADVRISVPVRFAGISAANATPTLRISTDLIPLTE